MKELYQRSDRRDHGEKKSRSFRLALSRLIKIGAFEPGQMNVIAAPVSW